MAYATYTTPALVCGSYEQNSADRRYRLFTRDAGMVFASARSVREERSKQRYALQDFSVISVSLVRGKSGWRIGSVEATHNPFFTAADRHTRALVVGAVKLVNRFASSEEPHPMIFSELESFLACVSPRGGDQLVSPHVLTLFELRLLYHLGYLPHTSTVAPLMTAPRYDAAETILTDKLRHTLERTLNTAREASQL